MSDFDWIEYFARQSAESQAMWTVGYALGLALGMISSSLWAVLSTMLLLCVYSFVRLYAMSRYRDRRIDEIRKMLPKPPDEVP